MIWYLKRAWRNARFRLSKCTAVWYDERADIRDDYCWYLKRAWRNARFRLSKCTAVWYDERVNIRDDYWFQMELYQGWKTYWLYGRGGSSTAFGDPAGNENWNIWPIPESWAIEWLAVRKLADRPENQIKRPRWRE